MNKGFYFGAFFLVFCFFERERGKREGKKWGGERRKKRGERVSIIKNNNNTLTTMRHQQQAQARSPLGQKVRERKREWGERSFY